MLAVSSPGPGRCDVEAQAQAQAHAQAQAQAHAHRHRKAVESLHQRAVIFAAVTLARAPGSWHCR